MTGRFVAVDGGQSALRLAVSGVDAVVEAPGFSYHDGDPVVATLDVIGQAWSRASGSGPVDRAVLGLTGLPSSAELRDALAAGVARVFAAHEVLLCADTVTAHAGALPDGFGVALAVGTGVGCLAVDPAAGVIRRVDGWGYLFGDDGSAFAIGRAGLAAVLRGVDGRGPRAGCLAERARQRYGPDLPQRLYLSRRVVDDTARFAPDVVEAAAGGDEVAGQIIERAGRELARTAAAGVAALPGSGPVPVASVGRLVEGGGALVDAYRDELAVACRRAVAVLPAGSSLDGAMRLAAVPDCAIYRSHLHIYRGPR
jgi:N-acetylglucosamine kinase-like BadF-type ATPase